VYITKISLETSDVILSDYIIFVLYTLYYFGQIDNLAIHVEPINQYGGISPFHALDDH
jgi:hypothetical protein